MIELFLNLHPILQALLATCFTWGMTAAGAAIVFRTCQANRKLLDWMLSFAAGAMIFVVVEGVIPESQRGANTDLATMGVMLDFSRNDGPRCLAGLEPRR